MKAIGLTFLLISILSTQGHKISLYQQQRSNQKLRTNSHQQLKSRTHSSVRSHLRAHAGVRYEESGFPTKVDFGEGDEYQINRESDVANGFKFGGWTNPLSWEDDGTDDDGILNLGYDTNRLKDQDEKVTYRDNNLDQDIKDTLDNEALSEELVQKNRVKWAEMAKKEAEEDAQIEKADEQEKKASKKAKGKKAPAAADEEENSKASVAGEKENTKKAPKNKVKQEAEEKTEEKEEPKAKEKPAAKEEGEESKEEKSEEKPAPAKKAKKAAKAAEPAKEESKSEEKAESAEESSAKKQSAAQINVEDLSDSEINYIQKRINQAQTTDLLDQDLNENLW